MTTDDLKDAVVKSVARTTTTVTVCLVLERGARVALLVNSTPDGYLQCAVHAGNECGPLQEPKEAS